MVIQQEDAHRGCAVVALIVVHCPIVPRALLRCHDMSVRVPVPWHRHLMRALG
jgi:hypothetical protein